jgi:SAM-dependent methyltransferase
MSSFTRVLDVVGSDVDHFECPRCGSHDRERHLLMYLEASGLLSGMKGKAVLHFAPEKRLSEVIAAAGAVRYLRCDLYPRHPGVQRIDMLNMELESHSFDLLIANHVMEHVADDRQALAEICRVLKRGGYAILQTPYSNKLHQTWQDDGIANENDRLVAYGQEDHVRLYGRDIFDRFEAFGLISRVTGHFELLPNTDARKLGVNTTEPFMLFQLPN